RLALAALGVELLRAAADFRRRAVDRLSRLTEFPTLRTEALFRGPEVLLDPTEFRLALVDSFLGLVDDRTSFVEGRGEDFQRVLSSLHLRLAVVHALRGLGEVCERVLDVCFVSRGFGLLRPGGY